MSLGTSSVPIAMNANKSINTIRRSTLAKSRIIRNRMLRWLRQSPLIMKRVNMAREMRLVLTDDFDGTEASETVRFSLDQATYELELSAENAEKLRETFAPYIAKARRVANTGGRGRRSGSSGPKRDAAKIREWAQNNGYQLGDRGRIPLEIVEAYEAAEK